MSVSPTQEAIPTITRQGELQASGLLTDGISPCLTASPHPVFGWQLSQPEDAEPAAARQAP
ncbi:hypothetical protein [Arthrobacter sp. ISL-69]|uniref:hypothetical protein n=1 Tax=Arthrobacter sp. ISL-69 TaxID=2819113 RepID=UPI001BEBC05D|nr:hypothetical protein [Arthrobacter sp. ISL-69]MBT2539073.1 hypothetical protein [Arthrobacter sp. ISL-69]